MLTMKINREDIENITSLKDFYEWTGIEDICTRHGVDNKHSIRMNDRDYDILFNLLERNVELSKYVIEKGMNVLQAKLKVGLDMVNHAPTADRKVPQGYVYIYTD